MNLISILSCLLVTFLLDAVEETNYQFNVSCSYLVPFQEGLESALDLSKEVGEVCYPLIDSHLGLKFGCGYLGKEMAIKLCYQWFGNGDSIGKEIDLSLQTAPGANALSSWGAPSDRVVPGRVNKRFVGSSWNNLFNRIDLIVENFITDKVSIFCGLTGSWDFASVKLLYGLNKADALSFANWSLCQWWHGIGPYTGICSLYEIFQGSSLCSKWGVALPWATSTTLVELIEYDGLTRLVANGVGSYRQIENSVNLMFDSSVGIFLENIGRTNNSVFSIGIFWDYQILFDHLNAVVFLNSFGGNYSTSGLSISCLFAF